MQANGEKTTSKHCLGKKKLKGPKNFGTEMQMFKNATSH